MEQYKADMEMINEWKEKAVKSSEMLDYLEHIYHTISRDPPPPPPPSNTRSKGKAKMDDLSGIRKENTENAETSDGRSTPAPNDLVLRLKQKILELQGELEQLYERLKVADYVTPIPVVAMDNSSQWVNPNKTCAYHSGMKRHTIDECRTLKDKIQTLIDSKSSVEVEVTASVSLEVEVAPPTATPTPFEVEVVVPFTMTVSTKPPFNSKAIPWDYVAKSRQKGKAKVEESDAAQGMTRTGMIYTYEHLGGSSKEAATKQPIIETGPDDLWRKVHAREYSVVDHLNKIPAQISILSLLQNSEARKNTLMKVLNKAYVPNNITCGEMANMVGQVVESHKITFHEDELPPEGLSHNWALHITVQFEDRFISRVLIDGGSSLNIYPLTTLKRLGKGFYEIRARNMNVKAFDGSQRATIGEINLCLQMGPTWFDVELQVLAY
ncbi:uncharacterized protein [Nicotiana sylvestris]|uniref:uncharacterized protein n=1 Tax=Nicotiana sylvestris TaxID=4096 RepID=UPI00388CB7D2